MTVDQGEPRPEHIATGKKEHRERELQCRCTHVKLRRPCRGGTQCEQRRCFEHMKRKTHTLHKTRATRHLLLLDLCNWTAKKCLCCSDPRSSDRPRSCACAKADAYLYSVGDAQLDHKNAGEERRPPQREDCLQIRVVVVEVATAGIRVWMTAHVACKILAPM